MEFNSIIFPKPMLDPSNLEYFKEELIFIPKIMNKDYIPCLFLKDYNSQTKI